MPKYLIARGLPNAGQQSGGQLHDISAKSNTVLREMRSEGKDINWLHSYVTDDGITCVYVAATPELVQEHARRGGFPCDGVTRVADMIDPASGE